ncbi:MarR family winged helix-turn-helix transcriptional regulator [Demequina sp. NBRC 110054]|uniref:MarR family winged helix-turn-helix transcriptional regulator n=1 Tax=Demequina sp. NBRC 110054 TaxID=1570343 RepID=UPI000A05989E|nr:MarR family transcriptional regulator [Demequina sp. NBRC 110054]
MSEQRGEESPLGASADDSDAAVDEREALIARVLDLQRSIVFAQMGQQSALMGDHRLTVAQLRLLLFIHARPGRPTAEAAAFVGVLPSILTGIVKRLVERGWVESTTDVEDRRVRRLTLAPEGATLVEGIAGAAEKDFTDDIGVLDDAQLAQLEGILSTIVRVRAGDN